MNVENRLTDLAPVTLEQYHLMVRTGVIGEDEPFELLEGVLVVKDQGKGPGMGHGPLHAFSLTHLNDWLKAKLGPDWVIRCQLPITLPSSAETEPGREPEPDILVAEGPNSRYQRQHPTPRESRLLVEVADTSLSLDRLIKGPTYAQAGVALYWIVNLLDRQLEVFSCPDSSGYRDQQILNVNQQVALAWEGMAPITVEVSELFPS